MSSNGKKTKAAAKAQNKQQSLAQNKSFGKLVSAPVSAQRQYKGSHPQYSYRGDRLVVRHCERFGSVNGSVAFAATSYPCNPGLLGSFPWLAAIATRYENYRVSRMRYVFRNKCATTFTGDVTLCFDYDASDAAPTSTIQVENWDDSVNGSPWQDIEMNLSKLNLHKELEYYTRRAPLSANNDVKLYDMGNFYICTEGQASTALVGYLYCDYEIEFFTPQLNYDDENFGGLLTGSTSLTPALPFGTAGAFNVNSVGVSVNNSGANTVVSLRYPGTYLFGFQMTGTTFTGSATVTGSSGVSSVVIGQITNAAANTYTAVWRVVSSVESGTCTISVGAATVTASQLMIATAPQGSLF